MMNKKIKCLVSLVLILLLYNLSGCSVCLFDLEEQRLEKYMIDTYKEWYVNTSIGVVPVYNPGGSGISYFKGYFLSDPKDVIQVDYLNGKEYSKYYWSDSKSEPVYGDYLNSFINRYFEVLNYEIYMQKGNRYQHFDYSMTMDDIISYLKENNLDIYITGNIEIDSQDSSRHEFESMCKVLYDDLNSDDLYFEFNLRGILKDGQPVEAKFMNLKWLGKAKNKVEFTYIDVEKEEQLEDVVGEE